MSLKRGSRSSGIGPVSCVHAAAMQVARGKQTRPFHSLPSHSLPAALLCSPREFPPGVRPSELRPPRDRETASCPTATRHEARGEKARRQCKGRTRQTALSQSHRLARPVVRAGAVRSGISPPSSRHPESFRSATTAKPQRHSTRPISSIPYRARCRTVLSNCLRNPAAFHLVPISSPSSLGRYDTT